MLLSPLRRRGSRLIRHALRRATRGAGDVGDYRYVFVVTYGRSGSTLLAGLLNAIPGYRIRGENYNTLYRLFQADAAIAKACDMFAGVDHLGPESAWYGTPQVRPHLYRAGLIESFVTNVLRPEPGDRVIGFKEIRYTPLHMTDLTEYLAFIRDSFPRSKIIFNHRDPAAVARSGWWVDDTDAEAKIRAADERLLTYSADRRNFHFFYDRIDGGLDHIHALLRFLGEDLDDSSIRAVLGRPYSPYPRKAPL